MGITSNPGELLGFVKTTIETNAGQNAEVEKNFNWLKQQVEAHPTSFVQFQDTNKNLHAVATHTPGKLGETVIVDESGVFIVTQVEQPSDRLLDHFTNDAAELVNAMGEASKAEKGLYMPENSKTIMSVLKFDVSTPVAENRMAWAMIDSAVAASNIE